MYTVLGVMFGIPIYFQKVPNETTVHLSAKQVAEKVPIWYFVCKQKKQSLAFAAKAKWKEGKQGSRFPHCYRSCSQLCLPGNRLRT